MPNLYINDGKSDVSVAELAVVLGKQQVVLGNFERDFILRTAGNIKVQVGNKMYDLPFTNSSTNSGIAITSTTSIIATEADLATLTYPGDGSFVYVLEDKALYIADNSGYTLLVKAVSVTTPKVYLSYDTAQTLNGSEKLQVVLNTGSYVSSIQDVSTYAASDVYAGQLVYAIKQNRHYRLIDPANPSLVSSWKELYISTAGGLITGPVTLSVLTGTTQSLAALHIVGSYANTKLAPLLTSQPILAIGAVDFSSGLAMWTNNNNVYFELLSKTSNAAYDFLTILPNGIVQNPFSISRNNVAIGGAINYNYNLAVNGSSLFTSAAVYASSLSSTSYVPGPTGTGFSMYKDTSGYTLEVDNLIVRNSNNTSAGYRTQGLAGATIVNFPIIIQEADFVEDLPVYITAAASGKYSDTSGTVRPLSDKGMRVAVLRTSVDTLSSNFPDIGLDVIRLTYAMGDILDDDTGDATVTYNQDADLSYYTPVGDTSYDPGTVSFIPDPSGPLLLINTISIYFIKSTSFSLITEGDLLYFKQWDDGKNFSSAIHAEVVRVEADGYYVYVYDQQNVVPGMQLVKIGNIDGTGGLLQMNAADLNNPFLELAAEITSFNSLYENYYYEKPTDAVSEEFSEDSLTRLQNLKVKIGDLTGIIDSDLQLTGSTQYGLYSPNVYLTGNFVSFSTVFYGVPTVLTFDKFIMMGADNRLEQIDMSSKFAYWDAKANNTITITATGNGIVGGGNLTANRTISLDFTYLDGRYLSGGSGSYIALETPSGTVNGSNVTFTAANAPLAGKEMVFLNGLLQKRTTDYSISGVTITFVTAPFSGDWLTITYFH